MNMKTIQALAIILKINKELQNSKVQSFDEQKLTALRQQFAMALFLIDQTLANTEEPITDDVRALLESAKAIKLPFSNDSKINDSKTLKKWISTNKKSIKNFKAQIENCEDNTFQAKNIARLMSPAFLAEETAYRFNGNSVDELTPFTAQADEKNIVVKQLVEIPNRIALYLPKQQFSDEDKPQLYTELATNFGIPVSADDSLDDMLKKFKKHLSEKKDQASDEELTQIAKNILIILTQTQGNFVYRFPTILSSETVFGADTHLAATYDQESSSWSLLIISNIYENTFDNNSLPQKTYCYDIHTILKISSTTNPNTAYQVESLKITAVQPSYLQQLRDADSLAAPKADRFSLDHIINTLEEGRRDKMTTLEFDSYVENAIKLLDATKDNKQRIKLGAAIIQALPNVTSAHVKEKIYTYKLANAFVTKLKEGRSTETASEFDNYIKNAIKLLDKELSQVTVKEMPRFIYSEKARELSKIRDAIIEASPLITNAELKEEISNRYFNTELATQDIKNKAHNPQNLQDEIFYKTASLPLQESTNFKKSLLTAIKAYKFEDDDSLVGILKAAINKKKSKKLEEASTKITQAIEHNMFIGAYVPAIIDLAKNGNIDLTSEQIVTLIERNPAHPDIAKRLLNTSAFATNRLKKLRSEDAAEALLRLISAYGSAQTKEEQESIYKNIKALLTLVKKKHFADKATPIFTWDILTSAASNTAIAKLFLEEAQPGFFRKGILNDQEFTKFICSIKNSELLLEAIKTKRVLTLAAPNFKALAETPEQILILLQLPESEVRKYFEEHIAPLFSSTEGIEWSDISTPSAKSKDFYKLCNKLYKSLNKIAEKILECRSPLLQEKMKNALRDYTNMLYITAQDYNKQLPVASQRRLIFFQYVSLQLRDHLKNYNKNNFDSLYFPEATLEKKVTFEPGIIDTTRKFKQFKEELDRIIANIQYSYNERENKLQINNFTAIKNAITKLFSDHKYILKHLDNDQRQDIIQVVKDSAVIEFIKSFLTHIFTYGKGGFAISQALSQYLKADIKREIEAKKIQALLDKNIEEIIERESATAKNIASVSVESETPNAIKDLEITDEGREPVSIVSTAELKDMQLTETSQMAGEIIEDVLTLVTSDSYSTAAIGLGRSQVGAQQSTAKNDTEILDADGKLFVTEDGIDLAFEGGSADTGAVADNHNSPAPGQPQSTKSNEDITAAKALRRLWEKDGMPGSAAHAKNPASDATSKNTLAEAPEASQDNSQPQAQEVIASPVTSIL